MREGEFSILDVELLGGNGFEANDAVRDYYLLVV